MTTVKEIRFARAQSIKPLINALLPSNQRSESRRGLASRLSYRVLDDFDLFQMAERISHFRDQQPQKFREFLANL